MRYHNSLRPLNKDMKNTKIELQYPYSEDFKAGYLNINKEPRKTLLLVRNDGSKTSTSYARYLMSVHLQRYLKEEEHVDHIDNDKLNDNIANLQILSAKDNNIKKNKFYDIKEVFHKLECPVCKNIFYRSSKNAYKAIVLGKKQCCSRSCGGKFSYINKTKNMEDKLYNYGVMVFNGEKEKFESWLDKNKKFTETELKQELDKLEYGIFN
jgi:hypothetical protein